MSNVETLVFARPVPDKGGYQELHVESVDGIVTLSWEALGMWVSTVLEREPSLSLTLVGGDDENARVPAEQIRDLVEGLGQGWRLEGKIMPEEGHTHDHDGIGPHTH